MAIRYRKNGVDLEELYDFMPIENSAISEIYESNMTSSLRFLINGVPIREATGLKGMNKDGINPTAKGFNFLVNNMGRIMPSIGTQPYARYVAELDVGEHTIDIVNEYITIDGVNTNILYKRQNADALTLLICGGGGGGAGSGLTYCSAGGGGGGTGIIQLYDNAHYSYKAQFPINVYVGRGGEGGDKQHAGNDGEATKITLNFKSNISEEQYNVQIIANGGKGGGIDDNNGGEGGAVSYIADYDVSDVIKRCITGGNGGKKEKTGGSSSRGYYNGYFQFMLSNEVMWNYIKTMSGGRSSGNNYGGGGGASGLADGAAANSKKEGINGTFGAGGSGAGFTAFTSSRGGNGGDGLVRVYF